MHAKNFIHRDLKWSNVLVFDKEAKIIKLADLGFCEKDVNITSCRGTEITLAPEVLNRSLTSPICGKATDIYSLGVMIMQMFPCIQHETTLYNLIYRLINLNPSDRPNIRTAKNIFQEVKRIMLHDISFINEQDKQKEETERRKCQLNNALCLF
jgi:serine/threonine protein kinase